MDLRMIDLSDYMAKEGGRQKCPKCNGEGVRVMPEWRNNPDPVLAVCETCQGHGYISIVLRRGRE